MSRQSRRSNVGQRLTVASLLDEDEKNDYENKQPNDEFLIRLVIERNSARKQYKDFQEMNAKMLEKLRAKSIELTKKIAERRNQLERGLQ